MLQITIPAIEYYDESIEEFVTVSKEQTLTLEHSLVSLSKWESKWCKPFLSEEQLTNEESTDYIRCMTLTQNVPPEVYNHIPSSIIQQVMDYINAPMTATWFSDDKTKKKGRGKKEIVTNEVIYGWMTSLQIPFDPCQKWHLNRLITLIRVVSINNTPSKKMSKKDILSQNAALNAARRKQFNSRG